MDIDELLMELEELKQKRDDLIKQRFMEEQAKMQDSLEEGTRKLKESVGRKKDE